MKRSGTVASIAGGIALVIVLCMVRWNLVRAEGKMVDRVYTVAEAVKLFDLSVEDIQKNTEKYVQELKKQVDAICSLESPQRTYENTFGALDSLMAVSDIAIFQNICSTLEMVSPDENIRHAGLAALQTMGAAFIDSISNNKRLYQACEGYVNGNMTQEKLSDAQRYFITETMSSFKRAGLQLPDDKLEWVRALNKEIVNLGLQFDQAIAADTSAVLATREELSGVEASFIDSLTKNDDGFYVLPTNYPVVKTVMTTCTNGALRKKISQAFNNRAYPANDMTLKDLMTKRHELALVLGYPDFASLNLSDQMIGSPQKAREFLHDLKERAQVKADDEFTKLRSIRHPSLTVNKDGKIMPWDLQFIEEMYRKEHYSVDDELVATYFPVDSTIEGLLGIYRDFFGITFKEVPVSGAWDPTVRALQVFSDEQVLLGTLFIDLHPRPGKYTHACQLTIVPSCIYPDDKKQPGVAVVLANFPAESADRPALLKLDDVSTFFHEFGHALHQLLGATKIASLSGTNTKLDFVELPSQLLEEWLWDKDILKRVSNHYVTHEPLPDDMIANIIKLKQFDTGYFVARQSYLSLLALDYYSANQNIDLYQMMRTLYQDCIKNVAFNEDSHFYASFGHLYSYGARYYGYLWSKVFAADVFDTIKQQGLTNSVVGKRYVATILAPGGTKDPNELLHDFLGREPKSDAFFKDMGI
jgi:thimet oligopeptidase